MPPFPNPVWSYLPAPLRWPLGVLVGLCLLWTSSWWLMRSEDKKPDTLLQPKDTTDLTRIDIETEDNQVVLGRELQSRSWQVNGPRGVVHEVEEDLHRVLLKILLGAELRPIRSEDVPTTETKAYRLKLYKKHLLWKSFDIIGHRTSHSTYLRKGKDKDEVYLWSMVGYDSYLAGVLDLTPTQWRNRVLIKSSWFTLKRLSVWYPDAPDDNFTLVLDKYAPRVLELENMRLDTVKIRQYVDLFRQFLVNEYILPGQVPKYDSLSQTAPLAALRIEDIYKSSSHRLWVRKGLADDYYLIETENGDWALSEAKRWKSFLARRKDFVPL